MRDAMRSSALERLQQLQEVSAALSRSLDRDDVERELARHVARMIACTGVVVARSADHDGATSVVLHWREGAEQDVESAALVLDAVAEASRTGLVARTGPENPPPGTHARRRPRAAPSVLAVPLRVGYKLAGVLAVYGDEASAFGSEEEELLGTLGTTAATALVNASLFAESLRDKRQSEALAALAASLGLSLKPAEVLRLSLRHAAAILGAEGAVVALRRGEFLHIVAAPLLTPDGPIGVLSVANRAADFTDDDARVLERLAAQVARSTPCCSARRARSTRTIRSGPRSSAARWAAAPSASRGPERCSTSSPRRIRPAARW